MERFTLGFTKFLGPLHAFVTPDLSIDLSPIAEDLIVSTDSANLHRYLFRLECWYRGKLHGRSFEFYIQPSHDTCKVHWIPEDRVLSIVFYYDGVRTGEISYLIKDNYDDHY